MKNKNEASQLQRPRMALAVDVRTIFKVQIPDYIKSTNGSDSSFLVEIEQHNGTHRNEQNTSNVIVDVPCPQHAKPGQWLEITMDKNHIENISLLAKADKKDSTQGRRKKEKKVIKRSNVEFDMEKSKFLCRLTMEYNSEQAESMSDNHQGRSKVTSNGKSYSLSWTPFTLGRESLSTGVDNDMENQFQYEEMLITTPTMMMISPSDIAFVKEQQPLHKKVKWFQEMCMCLEMEQGLLRMSVRRQYVLEDSFEFIMGLQRAEDLRKLWSDDSFRFVSPKGEEQQQQQGHYSTSSSIPSNIQWFRLVSKKLFDPQLGLWMFGEDNIHMVINPTSETSFTGKEQQQQQTSTCGHLDYFRFTGRLLGMALLYGKHISAYLNPYLYKLLLSIPLQFDDLKSIDNESYNKLFNLISMSAHGHDISNLELDGVLPINLIDPTLRASRHTRQHGEDTLSTDDNGGGNNNDNNNNNCCHDGGNNDNFFSVLQQDINYDNLEKYMEACIKYKLISCVESQLIELLRGFQDVIPSSSSNGDSSSSLVSVFNQADLDQILSDPMEEFNMDYLKRQTITMSPSPSMHRHPCIDWFWKVANRLDKDRKIKLCLCLYKSSKVKKHDKESGSNKTQMRKKHMTPKQLAMTLHHEQYQIHVGPCAHFRLEDPTDNSAKDGGNTTTSTTITTTTSSNHIIKLHIPKCNTQDELQNELISWIDLQQDLLLTRQ